MTKPSWPLCRATVSTFATVVSDFMRVAVLGFSPITRSFRSPLRPNAKRQRSSALFAYRSYIRKRRASETGGPRECSRTETSRVRGRRSTARTCADRAAARRVQPVRCRAWQSVARAPASVRRRCARAASGTRSRCRTRRDTGSATSWSARRARSVRRRQSAAHRFAVRAAATRGSSRCRARRRNAATTECRGGSPHRPPAASSPTRSLRHARST